MDRFSCAAEIISGDGALAALEVWRGKRMLLVTQPHLERDGRAQQVLQAGRFGQTMFFSVDREHPTVNLAAEGAAKLKAFSPDVVAVLGDSRVADCAGMMVYFGKRGCPLVMIPTVPWAGRETAAGAELTHEGIRYCVADRSLEPAKVILEPGLASADARNSLAQQGFETLVNALESCTAINAGPWTELFARDAFCSTWAVLPGACTGRETALRRLSMASVMAGMAWGRSGLGLCHALAGTLSSLFRLEPGRLKAVLLPAVIGCNAHGAGRKYAELARAAGMGGGKDAAALGNLKDSLLRLRRELDLPQTLAQAGLHPGAVWAKAGQIVRQTLNAPAMTTNPVAVDDFMIRRILEEVTGRI